MSQQQYNQWRAMLAITKGGLKAMLRSPSAVLFSIAFPLIFILVFGFIGGNGGAPVYKLVLKPGSDTANQVYALLKSIPNVRFVQPAGEAELESDLVKGRITGVIAIQKASPTDTSSAPFQISFRSTSASGDKLATFLPFLENVVGKIDDVKYPDRPTYANINAPQITEVRKYRTIDFILPGQLGFSLLSAGVFGVAFLFFNLRQTLVLKRFYATPIKRTYIVLGEGLARVIFQLMTAVVIIGIGHFAFKFTLINGWLTFFEIIILSFLALLVFMGFGFIISSVAKNESSIPPFANLITLPQFLLAGTFFSIDVFPSWLQPICRILPLTYFNDAMRKIAFEGAHLTDTLFEIGVIALWGIIVYAVAVRVFKWE
ncbi:MAG: ABC transporter permease [Chitinophagaceae bacterium]|nr:ABC transporter permease [Chitinophagaceae bacterium]